MNDKTCLALDIGGTKIKSALISDGKILNSFRTDDSQANLGRESLLSSLTRIISSYSNYTYIGICSAGQINPTNGVVTFATDNIKGYTGTDLQTYLTGIFGVPVTVENDVKAAAIGEKNYGAAKNCNNFICLTYGTGIGGCAITSGKVNYGKNYAAGEFGHIITHARGRSCTCGGHGCYEQYASANALTRDATKKGARYRIGSDLVEHLDDHQSLEILLNWIEEVCFGLKSLIYVYSPEKVVLGGAIMENKKIIELIAKHLKNDLMPNYKSTKIIGAELSNAAGLLGIAKVATEKFA